MEKKFEIKKLNNLVNDDSFIQFNIVNGFRFLDNQGEIVAHYHDCKPKPTSISPVNDGGILITKTEKETVIIDVEKIWAHYRLSDNLGNNEDKFIREFQNINNFLKVKTINRIGWRNHFVFEYVNENNEEIKKIIQNKFFINESIAFRQIEFTTTINSINFHFFVKGVVKKDASKTIGLLFDVDSYIRYKEKEELSVEKVRAELRNIRNAINSEDFVAVINDVLKK